jgi:diaminohydroxyphosphoribosylaminopyrimidine deaminase/5-amino-6-(5-phosphoribosylamino)uracil reductase
LNDLGRKNITSVLIEGGGEILGQALDGALIDKVQVYLGPIMTGGPVVAFAGQGAADTRHAGHLECVSYTRIADNVCVTGYPRFRSNAGE